jgi:hypothetical protein
MGNEEVGKLETDLASNFVVRPNRSLDKLGMTEF